MCYRKHYKTVSSFVHVLQPNTLWRGVEINCILVCSSVIYSPCPIAYCFNCEMKMMSCDVDCDGDGGDSDSDGDGGDGDGESDGDGDVGDSDGEDFVGEMMLGKQPVYRRLQSSSRPSPSR